MEEQILSFILKLVELGFGFYLVHNIFAKDTKKFNCSVDQNGIKFNSTFYKK